MSNPIQVPSVLNLSGQITSVLLVDPGDAPNTIISVNDSFTIKVAWSVSGTVLPYLGGEWVVRALVESIGQGFEGQVGPTLTVPLNGTTSYNGNIVVPQGTINYPNPGADTVYKLVVLVSHRLFGVKTQIAGFGEGVYFEIQTP